MYENTIPAWSVPAEVWAAVPKDAWWWMAAAPYPNGDEFPVYDDEREEC